MDKNESHCDSKKNSPEVAKVAKQFLLEVTNSDQN